MRIYFFILFCGLSSTIIAQPYFNKIFDHNYLVENGGMAKEFNDTMYIIGHILDPADFSAKIYIHQLDENGEILKTKMLGRDSCQYFFGNLINIDNDYYLGGSVIDNNLGEVKAYLFKLDHPVGDTLFYHEFVNSQGFFYLQDINISSDNRIIGTGALETNSGIGNFSLIKISTAGLEEWRVKFNSSFNASGQSLFEDQFNNIYLTGWTSDFGASPRLIYLIKTDSSGNFIWDKVFGSNSYNSGQYIIRTLDGNLLIAGSSYIGVNGQGVILKVDTAGNELWLKRYGGQYNDYFYKIIELEDSSVVAMGGSRSYGQTDHTDGWLVKTNHTGDEIWNKTYNHHALYNDPVNDYFYDFTQTSDGGFLMAGTREPTSSTTQDAWYMKVDSTGLCDTASCWPWLVGIEEPAALDEQRLRIYPNPAKEYISISLYYPGIPKNISYRLYNISGAEVAAGRILAVPDKHQQLRAYIRLEEMPGGIYLLQIRDEENIIGSGKVVVVE